MEGVFSMWKKVLALVGVALIAAMLNSGCEVVATVEKMTIDDPSRDIKDVERRLEAVRNRDAVLAFEVFGCSAAAGIIGKAEEEMVEKYGEDIGRLDHLLDAAAFLSETGADTEAHEMIDFYTDIQDDIEVAC